MFLVEKVILINFIKQTKSRTECTSNQSLQFILEVYLNL